MPASQSIRTPTGGTARMTAMRPLAVRSAISRPTGSSSSRQLSRRRIVSSGDSRNKPIASTAGRYRGTFAAKDPVYAYAMWISAQTEEYRSAPVFRVRPRRCVRQAPPRGGARQIQAPTSRSPASAQGCVHPALNCAFPAASRRPGS
ncbi:MAG: hypothetical protein EOO27_23905 [Comamonadaceae bacterium]|nr:MAG: hypothetical protein EOO27_23905 [Comamonadaceae bacterium]